MTERFDQVLQWLQLSILSLGIATIHAGLGETAEVFAFLGFACLIPAFVYYIPTGLTFSEADRDG